MPKPWGRNRCRIRRRLHDPSSWFESACPLVLLHRKHLPRKPQRPKQPRERMKRKLKRNPHQQRNRSQLISSPKPARIIHIMHGILKAAHSWINFRGRGNATFPRMKISSCRSGSRSKERSFQKKNSGTGVQTKSALPQPTRSGKKIWLSQEQRSASNYENRNVQGLALHLQVRKLARTRYMNAEERRFELFQVI